MRLNQTVNVNADIGDAVRVWGEHDAVLVNPVQISGVRIYPEQTKRAHVFFFCRFLQQRKISLQSQLWLEAGDKCRKARPGTPVLQPFFATISE